MNKFSIGVLILAISGIVGCGGPDGPQKVSVSGEVTFKGDPVPKGEIIFRPAGGEGVTDAGKIENGKYAFDAVAGDYRVEIRAQREVPGTAKTLTTGESGAEIEQYIPEKYNDKSELKAKVTESGENKFDFPLSPK